MAFTDSLAGSWYTDTDLRETGETRVWPGKAPDDRTGWRRLEERTIVHDTTEDRRAAGSNIDRRCPTLSPDRISQPGGLCYNAGTNSARLPGRAEWPTGS